MQPSATFLVSFESHSPFPLLFLNTHTYIYICISLHIQSGGWKDPGATFSAHADTHTKKTDLCLWTQTLVVRASFFSSSSHRLLIFSTPAELKASPPATAKAPRGVSKVNLKHYKRAKRSAPRLFAQLLRCARGDYTQHLIIHLHLFT